MRFGLHRLVIEAAAAAALLLAAGAPSAADGPPDKVLRYAIEIAETGFDPAQISDNYSRSIASNLFDAPLRYSWLGPAGTLEPNTAVALPQVSADFRTFTFTLKPGILFVPDEAFGGQARELIAGDYVYSLKRLADPRWKSPGWAPFEQAAIVGLGAAREQALKTGRFDYDREIAGLRALDRYRFQITLERPNPRFPLNLADAAVAGAVAREVVEHYGDRIMDHPVGTGPFRLAEWRRSSRIVLARNPAYREEVYPRAPAGASDQARALADRFGGRRLPMIDRVEISPIEESQPRWLAFLDGEHNFIDTMPRDLVPLALPGNRPAPVLVRKKIQIYRMPEGDVTALVYNMEDPVVGGEAPERVALRRALNLGFDTDDVIASIYKYQAVPAQSLIQPGTYAYDPALHTENGDYDPPRANALLDVYGYRRGADGWRRRPDGSPLELEMNLEPDQQRRLLGEIIKRSFDRLGVMIRYKIEKWPENLRLVQNGQYQIWYVGLKAADPDSEGALRQAYGPAVGGDNLSRMTDAAYDRMFLASAQLPDGAARLQLIRQLVGLEIVLAPMKAVSHRYRIVLAYPSIVGYLARPFIEDWWRYIDITPDTAGAR
jgi:ABC-type transport system substrate-binding protein